MAVLAMKKLNICALKKDMNPIVEDLQALGVMEIDTSSLCDMPLEQYNATDERIAYERKATSVDHALDIIEEYSDEKNGLLSALEGKKIISRKKLDEILKKEEKLFEVAKEVQEKVREILEDKVTIDRNRVSMEILEPWMNLDIPMEFTHTKRAAFLIGTVDHVDTPEEIYDSIGMYLVDLSNVEVRIIHNDKHQTWMVAVCLEEYEESVENGLHALGFARISNGFRGIPAEEKEKLEKENKELEKRIEENKVFLKNMSSEKENLQILADYYRLQSEKANVAGKLLHSRKTVLISGYVPERATENLVKKLDEKYTIFIEVSEPAEDENVPVALDNRGIGKAVGGIVESFGLPKKGEIDPSTVMGWFYVFLFGLMLSDAAYGAIIFGTCFVLLKKFKGMEESLKTSVNLFMYCGISTFIWGILFGGYFGDVVTVFSQTFLGKTVEIPALWFAPINDPMKLLMYSMLFGIIHLFVGLGLKGYVCIRDKNYMSLMTDVVFWFMILVGLILMFLPSELFASLAQVKLSFPSSVTVAAKILAIVGAVGILLMAGHGRKNPGLRLALGAYDLYNITGWLSDLLSYSRLLALSLATGVIASVFNQMGTMLGNGIVGMIFFVIIFVIGHVFNMGINLLGAYVHTNRLQYVEFFGKFYEGGGRPFSPFKADTKYIDIREEIR